MNKTAIENATTLNDARKQLIATFAQGEILKTSSKPGCLWVYFINQSGNHCITLFELTRSASVWHFIEVPESNITTNETCPISIVRALDKNSPARTAWRTKMIENDDRAKAHKAAIAQLKQGSVILLNGIEFKLVEEKDYISSNLFGQRSRSESCGWLSHDVRNSIPVLITYDSLADAKIIKP